MRSDGSEVPGDPHEQIWLHRQNIQRYQALLANPSNREDQTQIRKLLQEEQEKLRLLGGE